MRDKDEHTLYETFSQTNSYIMFLFVSKCNVIGECVTYKQINYFVNRLYIITRRLFLPLDNTLKIPMRLSPLQIHRLQRNVPPRHVTRYPTPAVEVIEKRQQVQHHDSAGQKRGPR